MSGNFSGIRQHARDYVIYVYYIYICMFIDKYSPSLFNKPILSSMVHLACRGICKRLPPRLNYIEFRTNQALHLLYCTPLSSEKVKGLRTFIKQPVESMPPTRPYCHSSSLTSCLNSECQIINELKERKHGYHGCSVPG